MKLIHKMPFIILILTIFLSCQQDTPVYFSDFVEIEDIEQIEMSNNSGVFILTENQMKDLIERLSVSTFEKGISLKMGFIGFKLIIDGKEYYASGKTNGEYLEFDASIVTKNADYLDDSKWIYFKIKDLNLDNYKKM